MKPFFLFCLSVVMPTLALADIEPTCEELWFSRNAILNDAGYCFASPLGRSLFDNSDCTTQAPTVSPDVAEQIAQIQQLERNAPYVPDGICALDTNRTSLSDVSYIEQRKRLTFHPSTDGAAGSCIGYRGAPLTLHAAPNDTAEILGRIPLGASVSDRHLPWQGWSFAIVEPTKESGQSVMLGWYRGYLLADAAEDGVSENCDFIAG